MTSDSNPYTMDPDTTSITSSYLVSATTKPETHIQSMLPKRNRLREPTFILGLILLVAVNLLWTGASVLVQYIYEKLKFHDAVFLTYICNALFVMLLPIDLAYCRYIRTNATYRLCISKVLKLFGIKGEELWSREASILTSIPSRRMLKIACIISPIWFIAQGTYNWSLTSTSVTSSTILSTSSSVFTFGLSFLVLKEKFSRWKIAGVITTLAGAVLVALADKQDAHGRDTAWGDILCLISAIAYGFYTVAIRFFVPEDGTIRMPRLFGWLGMANAVIALPVVLILNFTGVSVIDGLTFKIFGFIVLKGIIDNVLSDLLWGWSIVLTSPTIATVALALTVPLAMFSDMIFHGDLPSILLLSGSIVSIVGFLTINVDAPRPEDMRTIEKTNLQTLIPEFVSDNERKSLLGTENDVNLSTGDIAIKETSLTLDPIVQQDMDTLLPTSHENVSAQCIRRGNSESTDSEI